MKQPLFFGWWQVVVTLLVQAVATGTLVYAYSVMVVPLATEFQSSRMLLMLGITTMTLASGLLSPWLGAKLDAYSIKRFMLLGAASLGTGFIALSYITQIWQMPVIYALFMALSSLALGPLAVSTLLARWFSKRRGLAMGLAAMGTSIGGFLFPPLLQWMIDSFEWRMAFRLQGGVVLLILLPLISLLACDRPESKGLHPDGDDAPPTTTAGAANRFSSTKDVLKERNFWVIALVMGAMFSSYSMLLSNLAPFALDSGATAEQAAGLISLIALFGLMGKLLFGTIADKVDLRAGLAGSSLLLTLGLLSFLNNDNFHFLVAGAVLLGIAAGGMLPVWGALMAQAFGVANYGRVMGAMNPVIMPFNLLSPPLAGAIYDQTGSYQMTFLLFAGLLCVAICLTAAIQLKQDN